MKKLLAISSGRIGGNTETYLKEALMGAEEVGGVEVSLVRLHELNIRHCASCSPPCSAQKNGIQACVIKDDAQWLMNEFFDADGVILGSPVFSLTPNGLFLMVRDRIAGSKVDVNLAISRNMVYDDRLYKRRIGGLISVGGAKLDSWTSMGLPVMHTMLFSSGTKVVDKVDVHQTGSMGAAALEEETLQRCHRLGKHVAEAMLMPFEEAKWAGEEEGLICPKCHSSLVVMKAGHKEVYCALCGARGVIVPDGEGYSVAFDEEGLSYSITEPHGLQMHAAEIKDVLMNRFMPRKDEVPEKMEKYRNYTKCIVRPPKKGE